MGTKANSAWQEIAADNFSGASEVYLRALQVLERHLSALDQTETAVQDWQQWLHAMLQSQPSMAPLYHLANKLALIFEQSFLSAKARLAQARALLQKERLQSPEINAAIARHAFALLAEKPRVLTHSYSGTLAAVLECVFERGVKLEVYLSEGRPANEGRRMAERLSRAGLAVHFFVDDARAHFINKTDLVLLGADRVSENMFVNKIGSRSTALLASAHKIPVAVLAARNKLWPANLPFGTEIKHAEEEVWPDAPPHLTLHNFYFEKTDLRLVQNLITEAGIFNPKNIQTQLRNFRAAKFWEQP